jgi:hypothetical protein
LFQSFPSGFKAYSLMETQEIPFFKSPNGMKHMVLREMESLTYHRL